MKLVYRWLVTVTLYWAQPPDFQHAPLSHYIVAEPPNHYRGDNQGQKIKPKTSTLASYGATVVARPDR